MHGAFVAGPLAWEFVDSVDLGQNGALDFA
jgi:hypothetical protein